MRVSLNTLFSIITFSCLLLISCTDSKIEENNNAIVENVNSETSEITCPYCGHSKMETLPTEVCLIRYTCENCKEELTPEGDDCCVFCTYGTHKCPSMQK